MVGDGHERLLRQDGHLGQHSVERAAQLRQVCPVQGAVQPFREQCGGDAVARTHPPRIVNLDEWAWHIIDSIQAESARNPDDQLGNLASELIHLAPPRPRDSPDHLGFAVPLRLRAEDPDDDRELTLFTTLTHFGTATDVTIAELRLEAFLPADATTSALLTELAKR
ncbi:hypothetical protein [Actinomadura sp. SCN-SB]|uniref:MmyB family transcriptional regulator n=1 Tax=Actinomadura sp. SCN-SB TaxID=3373092 RepID=UPI0037516A13